LFLRKDFHEECGTEAFRKFDQSGTGFITATDFEKLMLLVKSHLLTEEVKNNLIAVSYQKIAMP
jgi:solute carrier family 25 aspartate/glutamate transporter 12/13